jgi:hypothetical protein
MLACVAADPTTGVHNYTLGPWVQEDMVLPRTMGDGTLLPCGDVIILNGAQVRLL